MESEQFMKLAEDIRKELSRGNYQMDLDDLPFTGQARNVAVSLWEAGWRPAEAKSAIYRDYFNSELRVWANISAIKKELEQEIDRSYEVFPDEGEREAYVAGLQTSLITVRTYLASSKKAMDHWEDKETEALKEEGYGED